MKYSLARPGRIFVIRLEDGDILHQEIERLAETEGVRAGFVVILGGADQESRLVVGPERRRGLPLEPRVYTLEGVHEVVGAGTLFPDDEGKPTLHLHLASGRDATTATGCVRLGVKVWQIMEAVLYEIVDCSATRQPDANTGLKLLVP